MSGARGIPCSRSARPQASRKSVSPSWTAMTAAPGASASQLSRKWRSSALATAVSPASAVGGVWTSTTATQAAARMKWRLMGMVFLREIGREMIYPWGASQCDLGPPGKRERSPCATLETRLKYLWYLIRYAWEVAARVAVTCLSSRRVAARVASPLGDERLWLARLARRFRHERLLLAHVARQFLGRQVMLAHMAVLSGYKDRRAATRGGGIRLLVGITATPAPTSGGSGKSPPRGRKPAGSSGKSAPHGW